MLKISRYLLFFLLVGSCFTSKATHNRAGEITYRWLSGFTYEIILVTYTADGDNIADRCQDTIDFGDSFKAVVARMNGPLGSTDCGPLTPKGDVLKVNFKKNIYKTVHTYGGYGIYKISMFDRNRNAGVLNIPNSVNQPFYLETYLIINQFGGPNSSPILDFPPLDNACNKQCFYHNPGAHDPDGDSLSYELTTCKGEDGFGNIGLTIPGYTFPNVIGGGSFSINATTGTITWCAPQINGEWNAAFLIKEWRKNNDGTYELVGYVMRDMQITVGPCANTPPVIVTLYDTCVVAGTLLTRTIKAIDNDMLPLPAPQVPYQLITLSAAGGPFACPTPTATFAAAGNQPSPALGFFSWQTSCIHIRKSPYQVTIKASDNWSPTNLVDFKTFNITVVAPPPKNLSALPLGTSIVLKWNKTSCNNITGNKIIYYTIYRKSDCNPWTHGNCETGVPASSGFSYIGRTPTGSDTTFTDSNGGIGLSHGINYSYLVVAVYNDGSSLGAGAQSYASNQVCVQLKRDVPILTNVDVITTGSATGKIFVRWVKPLAGLTNLDTIAVPGPYEFRLFYKKGIGGTYSQVYSITEPNFSSLNKLVDTTFTHNNIDTQSDYGFYKLSFYANGIFVGSAQTASSVFLTLTPSDRKVKLTWNHFVPWVNYKYYIYRLVPGGIVYTFLDSTAKLVYTDTNGLANRATYCYKILSKGQYSDPTIAKPLLNNSQEACAQPVDLTVPCAPTLKIISDCQTGLGQLIWNNPNHSCSDDVLKYYIYFKPTEDGDLTLIDSVKILSDTIYAFDKPNSIAGCYVVTAIDSSNNESLKGEAVCVDNCPEFDLPNIITLNDDGINDFFKAIRVKYIKDIDLYVYNRWGLLVYKTTDPYFKWDGKPISSALPLNDGTVSEGTYFYICQANEIRVAGIKARYLKGFLQILKK